MLLPQSGRPQKASESPLEGGWIKRSSFKIQNRKHELRKVIKKYGTQIFTDKLFQVRLAVEEAMQ
ncbi:hypothetical protein JY97_05670 [Alkalispirochaeta odontotermitis]|nr:hypothetical protein JY97_05670 [Alkalispirochaeta odontotermitis]CAB1081255.1 hypothetical protein D1AOALGA4SA_8911 [Olavius algarvensis Delta 1 endosymbiont]